MSADWRDNARCRALGVPIEVFYPTDGDYRAAAAVCSRCPVQIECATEGANELGWWGGRQGALDDVSAVGACRTCGGTVGASGLRRPGGRWCSLSCYRRRDK